MSIVKSVLSISFCGIYGARGFDLHISLLMIVRISVFHLIIKSEIWTISNCSSLGHERIFCSVCLAMFLSRYLWTYYYYLKNHMFYFECISLSHVFDQIILICWILYKFMYVQSSVYTINCAFISHYSHIVWDRSKSQILTMVLGNISI